MRKWLVILVGLTVFGVGIGVFLTLRESYQMKHDWQTYAGTYAASGRSSHSEVGDLLVLRANGTWEQRRDGRVVDSGGKGTGLPGPSDLKRLNWLGPDAASTCAEGSEECPQPTFSPPVTDPLVYVPVVSRRTSNKGDFTTSGHFFRITRGGAVLVDEEGVLWERQGRRTG